MSQGVQTQRAAQAFEPIVDVSRLPESDQERAKTLAAQIDASDTRATLQYGVGAQRKISDFADNVLNQIRAKNAGYAGEILTELLVKVKDIDVAHVQEEGFLAKIPIIGSLFSSMKKFMTRYQKMSVQLEELMTKLDKSQMTLLKDITLLDKMHEKNNEYLAELDVYIAAGQIKLEEMRTKDLEAAKAKAESGDPLDAQKLQDLANFINRFEKKLHDLKLTRMIAIQSGPQLRLVQSGNQVLAEKIQSSIMNTIPLWKNQIVIAISIARQKTALKLQQEVSQTTNDLLAKNSEMLKQGAIGVAKESERGIVDIETLKKTNNDLISTIEETLKIQREGREKRAAAEKDLQGLEDQLKAKLKEVN